MWRKTGWLWGILATALLGVVASTAAEVRTWTDSTGKHTFEAELLSVQDGKVRLRAPEGKEVSVALDRLSEADRKYATSLGSQSAAKVPPRAVAPRTSGASLELLGMAEQFFEDLRSKEREKARDLLTEAAQALAKNGKSPLGNLPSPDDRAGAIKAGKAKVDGEQAEVPVQVRVGGKMQKTTLHFRRESDQWRVFAISAKAVDDDERTINFEEAAGGPAEEKKDPLSALVGQTLDLSGYTLDGKPLDMSQYKGKVVLIDFWATWCGPCREEIPNILANWQQHHDAGFEVIAISVDRELNDLRKFVAEENPPWTVIADHHPKSRQQMGSKYGIRGIPAFVLLGKDGKVAAVHCRGQRLGHEIVQALGASAVATADN